MKKQNRKNTEHRIQNNSQCSILYSSSFWILPSVFCLLFCILFSCRKEGPGGKASITGMVMHHTDPIPGAVVYIKYGAKESPGTDVTYYDASATADAQANYKFTDLKKGDYYLFGIGYDSAIAKTVTGGIPVEIKSKTETKQADVHVTEP